MGFFSATVVFLLIAGAACEEVTPVQKVVQLLDELTAKVKNEGLLSGAQYAKDVEFCRKESNRFNWIIKLSDDKSTKLQASIDELNSRQTALTAEIQELTENIATLHQNIDAEQKSREQEHAEYAAEAGDRAEALKDIKQAIEVLRASKPGALLQVRTHADRALSVLKRSGSADASAVLELTKVAQMPAGFQYQSNDIIQTLEALKDQFFGIKTELDNAEFERKKTFDVKIHDWTYEILGSEKRKKEKEAESSTVASNLVQRQTEHDREAVNRGAYQGSLDALVGDCEQKRLAWEHSEKLRNQELAAIAQAEKMLREKGLKAEAAALIESKKEAKSPAKVASFLQVQSGASDKQAAKQQEAEEKALEFLSSSASTLNSRVLSLAVMKARASGDNFVKIRGLIKDLMGRLQKESLAENNHKAFCDKGLTSATEKRDKTSRGLEETTALKEQSVAEIKQLAEDLVDKNKDLKDTQETLAEAMKLRVEDHMANLNRINTAAVGRDSMTFAINTVATGFTHQDCPRQKDICAGIAQCKDDCPCPSCTLGVIDKLVFLQRKADTEMTSEELGANIVENMKVILKTFQETIKETKAEEEKTAADFEVQRKDLLDEIVNLNEDIVANEQRTVEVKAALGDQKDLLENLDDTKREALAELGSLKAMCIDKKESFAERRAKAEAEIAALNEAFAMLESWDQ